MTTLAVGSRIAFREDVIRSYKISKAKANQISTQLDTYSRLLKEPCSKQEVNKKVDYSYGAELTGEKERIDRK